MANDDGNYRVQWRHYLIMIFAVFMGTSLLAACLFVFIYATTMVNRLAMFAVFFLVMAGICVGCYLLFFKNVYKPVSTVETALNVLLNGETEQLLSESPDRKQYHNEAEIRAMMERLRTAVNRQYSAEILKRQAEFSALQSQINPHFLYNTLEAIRGQALMEGIDEIAEM